MKKILSSLLILGSLSSFACITSVEQINELMAETKMDILADSENFDYKSGFTGIDGKADVIFSFKRKVGSNSQAYVGIRRYDETCKEIGTTTLKASQKY